MFKLFMMLYCMCCENIFEFEKKKFEYISHHLFFPSIKLEFPSFVNLLRLVSSWETYRTVLSCQQHFNNTGMFGRRQVGFLGLPAENSLVIYHYVLQNLVYSTDDPLLTRYACCSFFAFKLL